MPQPESATERTTNGPAASSVGTCSGRRSPSLIVSVPPAGIASRAFRARLTSTCSTWPGSACTSPRSEPSAVTTSMCSPIRRRSILFVSTTIVFRSTMRGCSTCLRPKARSCCVSDGGALRRLLDRLDVRPLADLARVEAAEQEAAVHGDDGQQVVEVVGDAAGEAADCVELLRLVEALLELLAVADVVHHPDGELGVAVRVAHERRREVTPHDLAVGAAVALLERVALALSRRRARRTARPRPRPRRPR